MPKVTKIPIDRPRDYEAVTGEILEIHFNLMSVPLLSAWQMNMIKRKLTEDKHLEIIDVRSMPGELIVTVKVIKNPFPLILLIGGVTAALSAWFIWNSIGKVYKLIQEPEMRQTINWALILAGSIVGLLVVKALK